MAQAKKLIHGINWKYLIVLDSYRFDYFKEAYKKYLNGELRKATVPPLTTMREWLIDSFSDGMKVLSTSLGILGSILRRSGSLQGKRPFP